MGRETPKTPSRFAAKSFTLRSYLETDDGYSYIVVTMTVNERIIILANIFHVEFIRQLTVKRTPIITPSIDFMNMDSTYDAS